MLADGGGAQAGSGLRWWEDAHGEQRRPLLASEPCSCSSNCCGEDPAEWGRGEGLEQKQTLEIVKVQPEWAAGEKPRDTEADLSKVRSYPSAKPCPRSPPEPVDGWP